MLNIFSWNVNGLRAVEKKGFVQLLKELNPDIMGIQETKAQPEQLSSELLNIEGYHSYFFSAQKKGYSGVALYSKEQPLLIENLGVEEFDNEGRTIIAHYDSFTVINCYFPNSQEAGARLDYKIAFNEAIQARCEALVSQGKQIVLMGDYNVAHHPIDLTNPSTNENNPGYLPEERAWMTRFLASGFVDHFREQHPKEPGHYSWWSYRFMARERNIGWRIDYVCTNTALSSQVVTAKIHPEIDGSDHCPVSITLA